MEIKLRPSGLAPSTSAYWATISVAHASVALVLEIKARTIMSDYFCIFYASYSHMCGLLCVKFIFFCREIVLTCLFP